MFNKQNKALTICLPLILSLQITGCSISNSSSDSINSAGLKDDPDSVLRIDSSMSQFVDDFNTYLKGKDYRYASAVLQGKDYTSGYNYSVSDWTKEEYKLAPEVEGLISPMAFIRDIPENQCITTENLKITIDKEGNVIGIFAKAYSTKQIEDLKNNCFPVMKRRLNNYVKNQNKEDSFKKLSEESLLLDGIFSKPEITLKQYFDICETRDISKCPIDKNTGKTETSCSTVASACSSSLYNSLTNQKEEKIYKDSATYFKHSIRAAERFANDTGCEGAYLADGRVNSAPYYLRGSLAEYRKKHIKEVVSLYTKHCKNSNLKSCEIVDRITGSNLKNTYTAKIRAETLKKHPDYNLAPLNEDISTSIKNSNIRTMDAPSDTCSKLAVKKVFSGAYVFGRPSYVIQVINKNDSAIQITEIEENRKGFKPTPNPSYLHFGDRTIVSSLTEAIEVKLLTNYGVCTYSFEE